MSNLSILTDIINLADEFVRNNRDEDDDLGIGPESREEIAGANFIERLTGYWFDLSEAERLYVATVVFGGKSAISENKPNFEKIYSEMMNAKQSEIINNLCGLIPYRLAEYLRTGIEVFEIEEVRSNTYLLID